MSELLEFLSVATDEATSSSSSSTPSENTPLVTPRAGVGGTDVSQATITRGVSTTLTHHTLGWSKGAAERRRAIAFLKTSSSSSDDDYDGAPASQQRQTSSAPAKCKPRGVQHQRLSTCASVDDAATSDDAHIEAKPDAPSEGSLPVLQQRTGDAVSTTAASTIAEKVNGNDDERSTAPNETLGAPPKTYSNDGAADVIPTTTTTTTTTTQQLDTCLDVVQPLPMVDSRSDEVVSSSIMLHPPRVSTVSATVL